MILLVLVDPLGAHFVVYLYFVKVAALVNLSTIFFFFFF